MFQMLVQQKSDDLTQQKERQRRQELEQSWKAETNTLSHKVRETEGRLREATAQITLLTKQKQVGAGVYDSHLYEIFYYLVKWAIEMLVVVCLPALRVS